MKKSFTIFTFILFFSVFGAAAQRGQGGFHQHGRVNMAAVLASKSSSLAMGFSSISEARTIINDIMDVVEQQQNFEVVSTSQVDNAAAMFYNGQRYILYNPRFINQLDYVANDRWGAISVLAHEIGHHLLGHTMDGGGNQQMKELASDEFSGLVLRRMGASLHQAQLAMSLISSPEGSASHPGLNNRLKAIARGWNATNVRNNDQKDVAFENSGNERNDSPDIRSNYPAQGRRGYPGEERRGYPSNDKNYPQQNRGGFPSTSNERHQYPQRNGNRNQSQRSVQQVIVYRVQFSGNRQQYFITSHNNVVLLAGNRIQTVARITATNNPAVPYVIYDDQLQLYVDRRGTIVANGRTVGVITKA